MTLVSLLPFDLQIQLGKIQHREKFKRVKKELRTVTRDLSFLLDEHLSSRGYNKLTVCYYLSMEDPTIIDTEDSTIINTREQNKFYWYLSSFYDHEIIKRDRFVYGRGINQIKSYLKMNAID
jgi:hypothetical protein